MVCVYRKLMHRAPYLFSGLKWQLRKFQVAPGGSDGLDG